MLEQLIKIKTTAELDKFLGLSKELSQSLQANSSYQIPVPGLLSQYLQSFIRIFDFLNF